LESSLSKIVVPKRLRVFVFVLIFVMVAIQCSYD